MGKSKRILAMLGVILLVLMYIITLIAALFSSPSFKGLFTASIYCTFVIPLFLYVYMLIYKVLKGHNADEKTKSKLDKKN